MPDEKTDQDDQGQQQGDDGEDEFWTRFEGMFDRVFDRWIERENAALEAEEAKQGGKAKETESGSGDAGTGDAAGRQPSDAERQRDAGRVGPGRYWSRAERLLYGRRNR